MFLDVPGRFWTFLDVSGCFWTFCNVWGRLGTFGDVRGSFWMFSDIWGCLAMPEDIWNINQFISSLFINKFQLVLRMMQSYQEARGWAGAGLELGWAGPCFNS